MNSLFCYTSVQRVTFDDLDAYKVVNNSTYFNYFERARVDYLRNLGFIPNGEVGLNNISTAVVENYCSYRKPAHFYDLLDIHVRVTFITRSSIQFQYIIERREDAAVIAFGYTNLVKVSGKSFKTEPFGKEFKAAVEKFENGNLKKMMGIPKINVKSSGSR